MNLEQENAQVLNLVQAMAGFVTPNFRIVTIEVTRKGVVLRFLFERDDPQDREEIEDIVFEFEALQMTGVRTRVDILVDNRSIHEIEVPGRIVYGRKEPTLESSAT